ncbi:unnamed protein product [Acanthoscelides obtectus]|uniref:Uncharacterized protein n=1 Tax=Acanthoscelides obtectus TaxID=200917 RepID=A0A9P0PMJ1_ACAOB|nr:unnamed protein product [Acanthoscelides obtectus]CAK1684063.1 hypothetical protein AOBTE_LOCUS34595 [Acanthoscelides obtectus]
MFECLNSRYGNLEIFSGSCVGGVSAASSNSSINSTPLSSVGSTPISSIGSAPMSVSSTPIVPIANPIASSAAAGSPWTATLQNGFAPPAPAIEDKYAALKDLDNEIRSQKGGVFEWSVGTTNAGAAFGTESQCQQGTALFGTSPVQVGGQPFAATFPEATAAPTAANPFGGAPWPPNPFKMNGVTAQAPSLFPQMVNGFGAPAPSVGGVGGGAWPPPANPFKVGCVRANSNNPFL